MKPILLIALALFTSKEASALNYFQCETKNINNLELPLKSHMDFNNKKDTLVVLDNDMLKLYNPKTLTLTENYDLGAFYIESISFSPNDQYILVHPKRKGVNNLIIDRKTKRTRPVADGDLFWLKENFLGRMTNSTVPEFFAIDPVTMKETKISTPGLTEGYWYGFDSARALLQNRDQNKVTIYSLVEKRIVREFSFEGELREFNFKKDFAIVRSGNIYQTIRISDEKVLFNFQTENDFSYDLIGDTLILSDSYGWTRVDETDRRPYQRVIINLASGSISNSDYTGPWQAIIPIDEKYYQLQVIDTSTSEFQDYHLIRNTDGQEIFRVDSPINGYTGLTQLDHSRLFSIEPSSAYPSGEKYKNEVGFFSLNNPTQVNYHKIEVSDFYRKDMYAVSDDLFLQTETAMDEITPDTLKLWQINLNCKPAQYKF